MIRQIKKMAYKTNESFMIGDKISDKICAKKVSYILNLQKKIFLIKLKELPKKINNYL